MTIANTKDIEVDILNSVEQSIARDWLTVAPTIYEETLQIESINNEVEGWLTLIKEKLYSTRSVESIFIDIEDNDVDIWVVIPERDLAVLDQLANTEWELLELFVSGQQPVFLIDFHIIYRCGRDIEDLAPTRAIRLQR